ncbi:MAG: ACP S-malonyltransferase [Candidatus Omnitrophica bacterium]|nr:ACP S-malonyltransferase [Candidatus Omnitrophota bacterium]
MVAYLFAGQGSQYIGMGKDLCDSFPQAKSVFDRADQVLGFKLSKLMFEGAQEELIKTANCQPAVLTMSIAALEAFKASVKVPKYQAAGYVAGLSLGEYSALVAAEVLKFEDAVYLVRRRGEFMEEEACDNPGKMLSIIGLDLAKVKEICVQSNTEIANINCPAQVVISGKEKEIMQAKRLAEASQAKMAVLLEVSGAFHSSLMRGATLKLAKELDKIEFSPPRLPFISNVTAKPVASLADIKDNLIRQVASSVLWEDSMKFILSKGVTNFIEFGPGSVLKGLMRRIDSNAQVINIEKKEDLEVVGSI